MNVSQNYFQFSELTATDTGLPNNPTSPVHLANLANLWGYLNSLREELGQPIIVNSAFRTDAVNEQVGGAKCSYHKDGRAADIWTRPYIWTSCWRCSHRAVTLELSKNLLFTPHFTIFRYEMRALQTIPFPQSVRTIRTDADISRSEPFLFEYVPIDP